MAIFLIFPLMSFLCFAGTLSESTGPKNFREAIVLAEQKIEKRQKIEALKVLQEAFKKEKRDSAGAKELIKAIDTFSELFLTEKAQQLYEDGRALAPSDWSQALAKLKEAQLKEPDNLSVLKTLARNYLGRGECRETLEVATGGLKINPLSESLVLLKLQALACLQKTEEFQSFLSESEFLLPNSKLFVDVVKAQVSFLQERYPQALGFIEKARAHDNDFPEIYYWQAQILEKMGKEVLGAHQTYVDLCRTLDSKKRRRYEKEPRTCLEEKSIAKLIESRTASTGDGKWIF